MMKLVSGLAIMMVTAGVAAADVPTVTNQDHESYQLQLDCKHVSAGQAINGGDTVELDSFKVGSNCRVNIYPYDNPYGKDGDYDPKKRYSSAPVKRSSECVIKRRRITCG